MRNQTKSWNSATGGGEIPIPSTGKPFKEITNSKELSESVPSNACHLQEPSNISGVEGKKKKFQPLKELRKIFSKKEKKTTNACENETNDCVNDNEGDWSSSHKLSTKNVTSRFSSSRISVSQENVVDPGPKQLSGSFSASTSSLSGLPNPFNGFAAELASKISHRRHTESNEDLGLSVTPGTSPGIEKSFDSHYKVTVQSGLPSTFSECSLPSMASSENDEDSGFGQTSRHSSKLSLSNDQRCDSTELLDFDSCLSIPLNHQAARHKLAVRPRRNHGISRHRRLQQLSPAALPSTPEVCEESVRVPSVSDNTYESRGGSSASPPESSTVSVLTKSFSLRRIQPESDATSGTIGSRAIKIARSKSSVDKKMGHEVGKFNRRKQSDGEEIGKLRSLLVEREHQPRVSKSSAHPGQESFFSRLFSGRKSGKKKRHENRDVSCEDSPPASSPQHELVYPNSKEAPVSPSDHTSNPIVINKLAQSNKSAICTISTACFTHESSSEVEIEASASTEARLKNPKSSSTIEFYDKSSEIQQNEDSSVNVLRKSKSSNISSKETSSHQTSVYRNSACKQSIMSEKNNYGNSAPAHASKVDNVQPDVSVKVMSNDTSVLLSSKDNMNGMKVVTPLTVSSIHVINNEAPTTDDVRETKNKVQQEGQTESESCGGVVNPQNESHRLVPLRQLSPSAEIKSIISDVPEVKSFPLSLTRLTFPTSEVVVSASLIGDDASNESSFDPYFSQSSHEFTNDVAEVEESAGAQIDVNICDIPRSAGSPESFHSVGGSERFVQNGMADDCVNNTVALIMTAVPEPVIDVSCEKHNCCTGCSVVTIGRMSPVANKEEESVMVLPNVVSVTCVEAEPLLQSPRQVSEVLSLVKSRLSQPELEPIPRRILSSIDDNAAPRSSVQKVMSCEQSDSQTDSLVQCTKLNASISDQPLFKCNNVVLRMKSDTPKVHPTPSSKQIHRHSVPSHHSLHDSVTSVKDSERMSGYIGVVDVLRNKTPPLSDSSDGILVEVNNKNRRASLIKCDGSLSGSSNVSLGLAEIKTKDEPNRSSSLSGDSDDPDTHRMDNHRKAKRGRKSLSVNLEEGEPELFKVFAKRSLRRKEDKEETSDECSSPTRMVEEKPDSEVNIEQDYQLVELSENKKNISIEVTQEVEPFIIEQPIQMLKDVENSILTSNPSQTEKPDWWRLAQERKEKRALREKSTFKSPDEYLIDMAKSPVNRNSKVLNMVQTFQKLVS